MAGIHITDIEAAINWWREREPSPDGITACREVLALAEVYALLVYYHETECDEGSMPPRARDAWLAWYATMPDAPCIAICSTSQGDDLCKGCGRTFDEVQHWPVMTPGEKRSTWRRITLEGTAWRFNKYAERALEQRSTAEPALAAPAVMPAIAPAGPAVASIAVPAPAMSPEAPAAAGIQSRDVSDMGDPAHSAEPDEAAEPWADTVSGELLE